MQMLKHQAQTACGLQLNCQFSMHVKKFAIGTVLARRLFLELDRCSAIVPRQRRSPFTMGPECYKVGPEVEMR
jgi:hypothetical protein